MMGFVVFLCDIRQNQLIRRRVKFWKLEYSHVGRKRKENREIIFRKKKKKKKIFIKVIKENNMCKIIQNPSNEGMIFQIN